MSRILVVVLAVAMLVCAPSLAAGQTAEPAGSPRVIPRPAPEPEAEPAPAEEAPPPRRVRADRRASSASAVVRRSPVATHTARRAHTAPSGGRRPR
ncbi:hypothetical protein [Sandaracinus amylolyticus]|uniref:hypothetical protein n=1 Tax=Sandaracinus amylolyticus TaxID=927083 RepID=UPI001F3B8AEA|nr:hypothetical protein [Sandaracinus amylolyticus]UJR84450.1 Hypothetical protein I5071_65290 [Sandaracinus amylolyticus]